MKEPKAMYTFIRSQLPPFVNDWIIYLRGDLLC